MPTKILIAITGNINIVFIKKGISVKTVAIKAKPFAFFPRNWIPPNLKDDLLGFEKLNVPYLLFEDNENPDFDRFKLNKPFFEDHLPLTIELLRWKPNVRPLNVLEARNPCFVFKVIPRNGCTAAFMPDVLEPLNLNFEPLEWLLSSSLVRGFFLNIFNNRKPIYLLC